MILDDDREFRKRFSEFLTKRSMVSVTAYGSEDFAPGRPRNVEGSDLVLVDEDINSQITADISKDHMVVMMHSEDPGDRERTVYKYVSAAELMESVTELKSGSKSKNRIRRGQSLVTAVTGYSGGCGKTSAALVMARAMARLNDSRSLVIAIRDRSDIYDCFSEEYIDETFNINMLILSFSCGSGANPSAYTVRDEYGAAVFKLPPDMHSDISCLTTEEFAVFLSTLKSSGAFDDIVLDVPGELPESTQLLRLADSIIVITDDRRPSHIAEGRWLAGLMESQSSNDDNDNENGNGNGNGNGRRICIASSFCQADSADLRPDESAENGGGTARIPYDPQSFYINDGHPDISLSGGFAAAVIDAARLVNAI